MPTNRPGVGDIISTSPHGCVDGVDILLVRETVVAFTHLGGNAEASYR